MKNRVQNSGIGRTDIRISKITGPTGSEPAIGKIYDCLFALYGPQGWWPLTDLQKTGFAVPSKTGSVQGYHPADYTYPQTRNQQFEIICGALLTQNTSWIQVEKALSNLKQINALCPEAILSLDPEALKEAIRPAGYYNQKAMRLKTLA
ncbi:MAG: endonuclease III domain-containing protein, partial [Methanosarcina flavescens]